jgi:hypothetical protein
MSNVASRVCFCVDHVENGELSRRAIEKPNRITLQAIVLRFRVVGDAGFALAVQSALPDCVIAIIVNRFAILPLKSIPAAVLR